MPYIPGYRWSEPSEPVPKSIRSRKPSASTRYAEHGDSGPGKLPAQPNTVSFIWPPPSDQRARRQRRSATALARS